MKKAPIFNRNDRMLEVVRDLLERDIVPLFVETEPRTAVGVVEHRVADGHA